VVPYSALPAGRTVRIAQQSKKTAAPGRAAELARTLVEKEGFVNRRVDPANFQNRSRASLLEGFRKID
jgi:hypothetical protein